MMHQVQRTGLTGQAVVGQLERGVRRRTLSLAGGQAVLEAEFMTAGWLCDTLGLGERGQGVFPTRS